MYMLYVPSKLLNSIDQIKKNHPVTDSYSSLFEKLKIRSNSVDSAKKPASFPLCSYLRKLILGVTIIYMFDWPLYQLILLIFNTLVIIVIIGTQDPFADQSFKFMELLNEFFVLVMSYLLMCLTNFVSDAPTRKNIGWIMIFIMSVFIAINLVYAFKEMFKD